MNDKFNTLSIIYEILRNDSPAYLGTVRPLEIIARQKLGWDETVEHLHELEAEGLISLTQANTAIISMTDKGVQHFKVD